MKRFFYISSLFLFLSSSVLTHFVFALPNQITQNHSDIISRLEQFPNWATLSVEQKNTLLQEGAKIDQEAREASMRVKTAYEEYDRDIVRQRESVKTRTPFVPSDNPIDLEAEFNRIYLQREARIQVLIQMMLTMSRPVEGK